MTRVEMLTLSPIPAPFINANHRQHWARKAKDTKAWRTAAFWHAKSEKLSPRETCAHVTVIVHRADKRRADVSNLAPTAKALVDGLTDAQLWPDDSNAYVIGPDLRAGEPWKQPGVEIIIRDAEMPYVLMWTDTNGMRRDEEFPTLDDAVRHGNTVVGRQLDWHPKGFNGTHLITNHPSDVQVYDRCGRIPPSLAEGLTP